VFPKQKSFVFARKTFNKRADTPRPSYKGDHHTAIEKKQPCTLYHKLLSFKLRDTRGFGTLQPEPVLADAGPNARPKRGALLN